MPTATSEKPAPKYRQLASRFEKQIARGEMVPGDRLPSFVQMHREFGATQKTVEKVFDLLEGEGFIERRNGSGVYVADFQATRVQTGVLGCISAGISESAGDFFWMQLLSGMRRAALEADLQFLLIDNIADPQVWKKVDGAICTDMNLDATWPPIPESLPCVTVFRSHPGAPSIVADDFGGALAATEYLIEQGHRRIAFLKMGDNALGATRFAGFCAAHEKAGLTFDARLLLDCGATDGRLPHDERAAITVRECLTLKAFRASALVAVNDHMAAGAMTALGEAGVLVPRDVSVIGFDGSAYCDTLSPRLSSVGVPVKEMGEAAVKLLLRQIAGQEVPLAPQCFPVALQKRASVARCVN